MSCRASFANDDDVPYNIDCVIDPKGWTLCEDLDFEDEDSGVDDVETISDQESSPSHQSSNDADLQDLRSSAEDAMFIDEFVELEVVLRHNLQQN